MSSQFAQKLHFCVSKQHSSLFVSICLQKHVYHARPMLSIGFYIHLQLRLLNAIPLHSISSSEAEKAAPGAAVLYLYSSIPLCLLGQTPLLQAAPLPWVKSRLSPHDAS